MTSTQTTDPARNRLVLAILVRLIPGGSLGESVLGDLMEEYHEIEESKGEARARSWLWITALSIGFRWAFVRQAQRIRRLFAPSSFSSQAHGAQRGTRRHQTSGGFLVRNLFSEIQLSIRSLRRKPGFSIIVVLTLAVGIGSNATVFSVLDALVLRPFPIPNIKELAFVYGTLPAKGIDRDGLTTGDFHDFRESTKTFEELHADAGWNVNLTGIEKPQRLSGRRVTPGYLDLLGVTPVLGRTLAAERDYPGQKTVVVSHSLWTSQLHSDPTVIGQTMMLDGELFEIVGVNPEGFAYPYGSEIWTSLDLGPETIEDRVFQSINVIGLLAPDRSIHDAQAELGLIAQRLAREHPKTNKGRSVNIMPLAEAVIDLGAPVFLGAWQLSTLFVLLIACVNVANLLIARSSERHQEITLRSALGASRWRITRLLFIESLVLALIGSGLALPIAWSGIRLIRGFLPPQIARYVQGWNEINIDGRVLLFAALTGVAAAVLFGLLPALRSSKTNLAEVLHGSRTTSGAPGRGRSFLVATEIALALALLVTAALIIRGAERKMFGNQGYDPSGVLAAEFELPKDKYSDPEQRRLLIDEMLRRTAAIPGVESASLTSHLPSSGSNNYRSIQVEAAEHVDLNDLPLAQFRVSSPDLLKVLDIPLLEGRAFTASDRADTLQVAIVSQTMAATFWPAESAVGKRFRTAEKEDSPWVTVVGVSGDIVHDWFTDQRKLFHVPVQQRPRHNLTIALRTARSPQTLANQLATVVAAIDPELPLYRIVPLKQMISDRTAGLRFMSTLMGIFGFIALGMAALGVYGLMSQSVVRRRHEIGVRLALGAQKNDVLKATLGRSATPLTIGFVVGLALAFGSGKLLANVLFGVVQMDWLAFVQSLVLLLLAAVVATWIPAWRASKLDPARTLRAE